MMGDISEPDVYPSVAHEERSAKGRWRIDVADAANSTIVPDNSDNFWPKRSIQKRQHFRSLLERYQRQLLCGCSELGCKTPTCLSFQKRNTKGPFRPYTVLSARALATFLASQDQPEKGLCPHLSTKRTEYPGPDLRRDSSSCNVDQNQNDSNLFSESQETYKTDNCRNVLEARTGEENDQNASIKLEGREKDPKSVAQALFDTLAMKQLYSNDPSRAISPESSPPIPLPSRYASASDDIEIKTASQCTQGEPPVTARQKSSLATGTPPGSDNFGASETPVPISDLGEKSLSVEIAHFAASKTASINETNKALPRRMQKASQPLMENSGADEETHYQRQHLAWKEMRSWHSRGQVDTHEELELTDNMFASSSTTTLAYFSLRNVFSIKLANSDADIDPDVHHMLQAFNRQTIPLISSKPSIKGFEKYSHYGAFLRRSTSYICNTRSAMLRSFVEWKQNNESSVMARSHSMSMITSILGWVRRFDDSNFMLSSLWTSIGDIYMHSPSHARRHDLANNLRTGRISSSTRLDQGLGDTEAAHIVKIALAALIDIVADIEDDVLDAVQQLRSKGRESPGDTQLFEACPPARRLRDMYDAVLEIMDLFENRPAISLAVRLAKAMASRRWMGERAGHQHTELPDEAADGCHHSSFMTLVMRNVADKRGLRVRTCDNHAPPSLEGGVFEECSKRLVFRGQDPNCNGLRLILEWMRTVILKEWDGKPEVLRCGAVGGAIEFLKHMYIHCSPSDTPPEIFYTPYLADRLDILNFPVQWASSTTDRNMLHLLSYPFLFPPATLISYFRAINHSAMTKAFQSAQVNMEMQKKMNYEDKGGNSGRGEIRLFDRLRSSTSRYLILDVRRKYILEDAMNQLWRREPGELMKPLKVRMGVAEGEEGVDLGGIQQEFFRLAIAEALSPKYGAFTTDETTRMTWFQPLSLEPCHMFEMVGLLTSLAIYNGLTLPFTFPRALYRQISGLPCETIRDIEDGWPELARGLQALLDWSEGDVEDVFMRRYTFSIDVFGTIVDTDMDIFGTTVDTNMDVFRRRKGGETPNTRENHRQKRSLDGLRQDPDPVSKEYMLTHEHLSRAVKKEPGPVNVSQYSPSIDDDGPTVSTDTKSKPSSNKSRPASAASQDGDEEKSSSQSSPQHSSSSSDSTPMVTNANRHQFVRDYIIYLTDISIRPQLTAFIAGFRRCLSPKSHQLFTEDSLKLLVEGHTVISTHELEAIAKYEPDDNSGGYHARHPTIRQFWKIVHEWGDPEQGGEEGQEKVKALLEFVTASDRLPVGGVERVQFVIQKNGDGDERLPSSMTCFGRLLLPEFSGLEAMRRALERAVQESRGFGLP